MADESLFTSYTPCPAGTQILRGDMIQKKSMPSFDDKTVMTDRMEWTFVTESLRDPETRQPYTVKKFTGTNYGPARAGLTELMDMMYPELTKEERGRLRPSQFTGRLFSAKIAHETSANSALPRAVIKYIEPVSMAPARPSARRGKTVEVQAEMTEEDPFAQDEEV